jgi:hypothetical protein
MISPAGERLLAVAESLAPYLDDVSTALLAGIGQFGPGQWLHWTTSLQHDGHSLPLVMKSNPSDLTSFVLRQISNVGDEVQDVAYLSPSTATGPGIPADRTGSPRVLVPRAFGFYDLIRQDIS